MKGLDEKDMGHAQLRLAHSYSRAKVKSNVDKSDNMIIALRDTLDKDVNNVLAKKKAVAPKVQPGPLE